MSEKIKFCYRFESDETENKHNIGNDNTPDVCDNCKNLWVNSKTDWICLLDFGELVIASKQMRTSVQPTVK